MAAKISLRFLSWPDPAQSWGALASGGGDLFSPLATQFIWLTCMTYKAFQYFHLKKLSKLSETLKASPSFTPLIPL